MNPHKVIRGNPLSPARIVEIERKLGSTLPEAFLYGAGHDTDDSVTSQTRYAAYTKNIIVSENEAPIVASAAARFAKTIFDNVDMKLPDPFEIVPASLVIEGYEAIAEKAPDNHLLGPLKKKIEPFYQRAQQVKPPALG